MAIVFNKVSYKDKLKNISYTFEEGKITSVLSVSGNGKTLFSYILSGLIKDYTGEVINSYEGRNMGYVFQNPEESFIFNNVREELKMVGLDNSYLDRNPFDLSSGEKCLLALGVVLSLNPKLLIIDDPTLYLDNKNMEYLIKLIKKLKNNYHKTIIIFTSDIEFAIRLTDNYVILKNGKICSSGNSKDLLNNIPRLKSSGIEIPRIIEFINVVNKKKNINLDMTFDIKELMKDIYRHV